MDRHPIESIMTTTMENIRDMVDVNTVIGDAVQTPDGSTVIPISKVSFGFVSGGGEYVIEGSHSKNSEPAVKTPFAGGAGAGVSVQPMGFLVLNQESVRLLPAAYNQPVEKLLELMPQVLSEFKAMMERKRLGN